MSTKTLLEWHAGSAADSAGRMHIIGAHSVRYPANKISPLFTPETDCSTINKAGAGLESLRAGTGATR